MSRPQVEVCGGGGEGAVYEDEVGQFMEAFKVVDRNWLKASGALGLRSHFGSRSHCGLGALFLHGSQYNKQP